MDTRGNIIVLYQIVIITIQNCAKLSVINCAMNSKNV